MVRHLAVYNRKLAKLSIPINGHHTFPKMTLEWRNSHLLDSHA